ncbi:putative lipoprotein [Hyphomonas neptunium ATCC 15444]|uniref:Putative lipoprotein n=2 Tax=Hyphomonas TaxID=85 RepID=Q0C3S8_HYPNA|nr:MULTISPECIES: hypothetical protein [Hyphomonas]ABI78257.1 putative lipoprotein [Hyphomonas neptunium ATCC 15444]KCZ96174.1 putative lipoprotein [Hyphomonas hirschiana VP5]
MRYLVIAASALLAACSPSPPAEEGETLQAELTSPVETAEDAAEGASPTVDPTALDFSRIALAMRIPAAFEAGEDGAYLQINVTNPRLSVDISEEFPLVQTREVTSPFLEAEAREGFRIWTYGTHSEDGPRLQAISGELARLKREAPGENELSFGAIAPGCWNEASQTPTSLKRTLYIRVSPEADFELFVPEQEIAQGDIPGTESFWAACGS